MKYRVFALLGILAIAAGSLIQAQDYDDIYYDASKSTTGAKATKTTKATAERTQAVYGQVPERYSVTASSNYRVERDDDEYNRRGAYDPDSLEYEVDINGDTIFEDAFANTRRIERFYNPDIVILSDDDELVELYYDESPTINLIVGSDWGYGSFYSPYYGWSYTTSYYPWYSGWYDPWYIGWGWYSPYRWHSPWYYGSWHWGWHYSPWYRTGWGWDYAWHGWNHHWGHHWNNWVTPTSRPSRPGYGRPAGVNPDGSRVGLATNRNGRSRVGMDAGGRSGISPRGGDGNRSTGVGGSTTRSRGGYATGRGGNMGSRSSSGVSSRSGGISRSSSTGTRSTSVYSGGSRSSSGYSGGSRSGGGSYSGGSRSSGGSYSGGSHSSGGSYSGGSRGSGSSGGGSHGGSSGGGGRRR